MPNIAENIFQLWLEAQVANADIRLNLAALNAIAAVLTRLDQRSNVALVQPGAQPLCINLPRAR